MQRLVFLKQTSSNLSKKLTTNSTSSLLFSHLHHKPFTYLIKHPHQNGPFLCKVPASGSSLTNQTHHFPSKIHGFLSSPSVSKHFLSNLSATHLRVHAKTLKDCNFGLFLAQFGRGFSGFNGGFYSGSRGWRSWRSWFNRLTDDNVVFGLIMANVAVFALWQVADRRFMVNHFMISLDNFKSGRILTLITSAFSHNDFQHLFTNMIGLYFFGTSIARTLGPQYLLNLYLAGAIGGSIFYLVHHAFLASSSKGQTFWAYDPSRMPGLGASGAVNAIMLLNIFLNPKGIIFVDFIIPVPAFLMGSFIIGTDVWRIMKGDSQISGSAHLGGAAVAAMAWYRIRRGRF